MKLPGIGRHSRAWGRRQLFVAVAAQALEVAVEPSRGVEGGRQRFERGVGAGLQQGAERDAEQVGPVVEVLIQRRPRHPRRRGEVGHRGATKALAREDGDRRMADRVDARLAVVRRRRVGHELKVDTSGSKCQRGRGLTFRD